MKLSAVLELFANSRGYAPLMRELQGCHCVHGLAMQGIEINRPGLLGLGRRERLWDGKQASATNGKCQNNDANTHGQASWPDPSPNADIKSKSI